LPSFNTGVEHAPDDGLPESTFDPALWQPSILETIVSYVERHGVEPGRNKTERRKRGKALFKALLDEAGGHRSRVDKLRLASKNFVPERWLCVVGVGARASDGFSESNGFP